MENSNLVTFMQIKQNADTINEIYNSYIELENTLNDKLVLLNDSLKIVKLSKHYKIESRKQFILDIINQALLVVFNSKYNINIISEENSTNKFNIKYKLVLYKDGKDVSSNNELYETSGGGVLTVISFILKILLGYINSNNKFYILDEVFSQISKEYRSGVAKLLRILSDKYGFTFLIISHEGLEQEDVDIVYHTSSEKDEDGFNKLVLTKEYSKQKEITAPYYQVDIENFQAIKKTSLIIKGVTVIHGATDSGKSAIQRAIRSLITNSFNVNLYPRWRKKRTKLTTKIRLTKVSKDAKEFVELEYRDKVIYRTHTGDEFVGKKLASSNIFEILENFGFAQIPKENIDKLTGEIKQQTQRIFVTTQFDKLYFAEDRNGLEKIFSIIFDSQLFNQLESEIKSDILSTERELKSIFNQKSEYYQKLLNLKIEGYRAFKNVMLDLINQRRTYLQLDSQIKLINNQVKNYSEIIYLIKNLNLINKFKSLKDKYNKLSIKLQYTQTRLNDIELLINYCNIANNANKYHNLTQKYNNIVKSIDTLMLRKDLLNQVIILSKIKSFKDTKDLKDKVINQINANTSKQMIIDDIIHNLKILQSISNINKYKSSNELIKQKLSRYQILNQLSQLNLLNKSISKYSEISQRIIQLSSTIENLSEKYSLKVCDCCNGIGYVST